MLEYEWGNSLPVMLAGDEPSQDSDQARQIFDHYTQTINEGLVHNTSTTFFHHHHQQQQQQSQPHHLHALYDPRTAFGTSTYPPPAMLSLETVAGGSGFAVVPKAEEEAAASQPPPVDFTARLGLNLGGRTYFAADDDFVSRLYRRSRPVDPGSVNSPRCQAEGCNADLTHAKHYHRRHKVCEYHSKASTVIAAGLTQRFCQQCSRFHLLSEFDNGKRSCRKRLADHNRRRRKSQQPNQDYQKPQPETVRNSSSEHGLTRSPPDSGAPSSSSVTIAVSPPRMSLDCFRGRPYQAASSASSSSIFFSSG